MTERKNRANSKSSITLYALRDERFQPVGISLYRDAAEMARAALACGWASDADDARNVAAEMMAAAEAVECDDGADIGNGYFDSWADIPLAGRQSVGEAPGSMIGADPVR